MPSPSGLYGELRRLHHALPPPLRRVSSECVDAVRRARTGVEAWSAERTSLERMWPRRLRDVPFGVRERLVAVEDDAVGLDLGGGPPVRPNAQKLKRDLDDMPLVDGSYDFVWCGAALVEAADPAAIAREVARVLRPGGLAFVQLLPGTPERGLPDLFPSLEPLDTAATGTTLAQAAAAVKGARGVARRALGRGASHHVLRKPLRPSPALRERPLALFVVPSRRYWELDQLRTREYAQALKRGGVDLAVVDVDTCRAPDSPAGRAVLGAGADFVTSVSLNYYLAGTVAEDSVVSRAGLPPSLVWDDPLGALANGLDWERESTMGDLGPRTGDPLPRFRALMGAPGAQHFTADSGHIEAMESLGLVEPGMTTWYPFPSFPAFVEQGRKGPVEPRYDLAFAGNIYEAKVAGSAFSSDDEYAGLTQRVQAAKLRDLGSSVWDLLRSELEALSPEQRERLGLHPRDTAFWDYYVHLAWFATTTRVRLELLTSTGLPVHLFGLFADPDSIALLAGRPNLVYGGHRHQFRELPETFAATKVNLCVSQSIIFRGLPSKFLECVASGGFALVDHKDDLVRLFGPTVEQVMFRTADEMNAKIEHFLDRPAERREIVEELRAVIERECTLDRAVGRVLERRLGAAGETAEVGSAPGPGGAGD